MRTGVEGTARRAGVLSGVARVYGGEEWHVNDEGRGRADCLYEKAGPRVHITQFIVARRVGDHRCGSATWGRERGVDDEYEGGQEEDDYENQGEGGGEARGTVRGDADGAMGERGAVEDGGPGGATKEGSGRQRKRGKRKRGEG